MLKLKIRKENNLWIFDDREKDIYLEPFVNGSSQLIDYFKKKKEIKENELVLIFSDKKFEGSERSTLSEFKIKTDWSIYFNKDFGYHELCPVLLKYFEKSPQIIYFDLKGIEDDNSL